MKLLLRKGRAVLHWARHVLFQKVFRKRFVKSLTKRQNQNNLINSYNLSAHLMDDLGFDRGGTPAQWSTFSKPTHILHEAHPVKTKRVILCVTDRNEKHPGLQARI